MKITDFKFGIEHGDDGAAVLLLCHGGDTYRMELTPEQRRNLGLNLLDPTLAEDAAPETEAE